ncbi:MAG TPA: hypothetical protein VKV06_04980, partial [Acidimicrobiales bacterium]|nr:hypothetical protein [Acidimicrobiales bacterium]
MTDAPLSRPSTLLDEARLPHDGSGRLHAARHFIEEGAVSVLTVDMFDTVVWRQVPRPTDAFVLLAGDLAQAGRLDPRITPATFRRIRIEAEGKARDLRRRRGEGMEVGIEEIWAQVPEHVCRHTPVAVLVEHEMAVEQRLIRADLDVVALIELAVERGCRVAVVSNTYLSAQQLSRLLARPETAALRQARIFASSAYGMSKVDGLWKIVLEELDVPADQIVHVGDERPSDVDTPGQLGVRAVHYPRYDDQTRTVLQREGVLGDVRVGPAAAVVVPGRGDYGLTALRAKVGARADYAPLPSDQSTAWRWGATVLGPALAGFADWVNRQAEEMGVSTVWCMMREGDLLADLIGRVATSRGNGLKAEVVWLSRHVTAKASIAHGDPEELRKLLNRRLVPTVAEFLTNLGISLGEVPELRPLAGERMDQPKLADEVVETLGTDPHLRTRIVAESAAVRARLLRSLEPALGTDPSTGAADPATVLVDLGWGGTIQRQLTEALRLAGVDRRLVGLYLATNELAAAKVVEGLDITGYLINCGEPCHAMDEIGRSPEIIEQSCLASCGSLADVTDDGRPILDAFSAPPEQMASKTAVQHGVRAFLREWLRYAETVRDWPAFDGEERPQLLEILRRSVSAPTSEEARVFGAWTHDDNFG